MKMRAKLLVACAALAAAAPANAAFVTGQISVGGLATPIGSSGWSDATGVDAAGSLIFYGAGTGSFAGLNCAGSCGTIADIPDLSTFAAIANFLTLNTNGIAFDLNSISNITRTSDALGGTLAFTGSGTIRFNGYDATPGIFSFTAQGSNLTSFSASAVSAAVPEPGTWALMLLGFGAVGYSLRRRRATARFVPQAA
ncbi:hypothetical protein GGQ97_001104 [Sphingomonas kaistensis]|uniref:Ice-binding protein C-terminal domain-containing protein n=1 Tax=Sphingomonas kaistensis TaxID=298708 RepID=A0A7X5Y569_9SPHN|nr:PEPxxWA-CTERM sorting domain-containing protein [Sphingomonas kaistensis]NJC05311.1 hypothetical protein [Sphingomonas kaistensis]